MCQTPQHRAGLLLQDHAGTGDGGVRVEGDLVNVLFDIYEGPTHVRDSHLSLEAGYRKICTVRKSRDVPAEYHGIPFEKWPLEGHRFTINVAPMLADLLSYSLTPPGIGTWGGILNGSTGKQTVNATGHPNTYGGMNGQWQMNNIHSLVNKESLYNLSGHGADRVIWLRARFEVMDRDGTLSVVEDFGGVPIVRGCPKFWICNSAPQHGDKDMSDFDITNPSVNGRYLTNSPNTNNVDDPDINTQFFKKIDIHDDAEYLQFFVSRAINPSFYVLAWALRVDICADRTFIDDVDTVYLVDFPSAGRARLNAAGTEFYTSQYRQFNQNVSPDYINKHNNGGQPRFQNTQYTADPITEEKPFYRVSMIWNEGVSNQQRSGQYQYYETNFKDDKHAWEDLLGTKNGVKFMWLNRLGGVDSYTAKRDIGVSLDVSQETITKQTPWRRFPWNQAQQGLSSGSNTDGDPFNSSILADMYPHSRETLNVNANKNYTVYTDPLTVPEATWLEELLVSPNVWIYQKTDRSNEINNDSGTRNLRPSKYAYTPVLITNGESMMIDEQNGLMQIQIQFTESHSLNTQRN